MICGGQIEGGFQLKGVASRQVSYAKAENEESIPMFKILNMMRKKLRISREKDTSMEEDSLHL